VVLESPGEAKFAEQNRKVKCVFKETKVLLLREKISQCGGWGRGGSCGGAKGSEEGFKAGRQGAFIHEGFCSHSSQS